MPDRTYSRDEVAAIIERAAERQRRAPEPGGADGLTLAEVERVCREAGLDPALVREAAAELDAGGLALESGSAATSVAERWADGPATAEGWEDAVDQLRVRFGPSAGFGVPDGVRPVGGGWEWTHQGMSGPLRTVSVSPRDGRTRVRVVTVDSGFADPRVTGLATGTALGLVPAMLLGALLAEGLGLGDLVGVLAVVLVMLASVALGGSLVPPRIRRRREQQAREARALAEDVARWVTAAAPASASVDAEVFPTGASVTPVRPALGLDLDDSPEAEAPAPGARRTRA